MKRLLLLFAPAFAAAIPYEINIVGLQDEAALKSILDASELVTLQERPPASINGLRYRAASDIPALLKVLRAFAYYDASITYEIAEDKGKAQVFLLIHPGPQYTLSSYEIFRGDDCKEPADALPCCPFEPESLGLKMNRAALSTQIVNAELKLLTELARCGYPLASVKKRRVEVDMAEKTVAAAACIDEGPRAKFGPVTIFGLKGVQPRYVLRKIAWKEGEIYNSDCLVCTQKRLLNSDLFSSVLITHDEKLDDQGELPMKMKLTEAKHRQVSIGAYYATVDGPGIMFSWVHRNIRGMGEVFSLDGDFSKRYLAGKMNYKKPDFLRFDQSYRATLGVEREHIRAYIAFSYYFANYLERKIDSQSTVSFGMKIGHVNVSRSATNGTYLLIGFPVFGKYTIADDILDPTKGFTMVYQAIPFQSLWHANQHFIKQRFTGNLYIPIGTKRVVLAIRTQFGSIAGTRQENVPLPELFLGGSEDDLRGYRYKTVSPLDAERRPLGGRSAIFATVETRFRITQTIGIVPFADFGTVSLKEIPQIDEKWFKSVGGGLRYYTFFGPLRLDIGFPLDRRRGIDPAFRIYASIGQTF